MAAFQATTQKHLDAALDRLTALIGFRTIAADPDSPIEECVAFLTEELITLGARVEVLRLPDAQPLIFAEIKGRSPRSLMFYQHYDVQPPGPLDGWDSDPFRLTERDGTLYGRGIADNKGNLAARIEAIRVLHETEGQLPITVRFLIEGEEEIGSPHLSDYLQTYDDLLRADSCLWEGGYRDAEGRFVVTLGIKGICNLTLKALAPVRDLHGKFSPLTYNPAVRLAKAITHLLDEDGWVKAPGFYDAVIPPNAQELAWLDAAAPDLAHLSDEIGLGKTPAQSGREAIERLVFLSTGNVDGFVSGAVGANARNIVPAEAVAEIGFRIVPDQRPESVYHMVADFLRAGGYEDIEIIFRHGVLPARTRADHPLVSAALNAVKTIAGEMPIVWPMSPGAGPMSTVCHSRGIPAIAMGVGHASSNTHAPNENIRLIDYQLGIQIVAQLLSEMGKSTNEV